MACLRPGFGSAGPGSLPGPECRGDVMGRQTAEPEHRFGASPPLTIGVEEELLLVDDERRLVAAAERVIEGLDPAAREAVSTEIFAAQIELKTGICGDAAAAATELVATCGRRCGRPGSGCSARASTPTTAARRS